MAASPSQKQQYIRNLYQHLLHRQPSAGEVDHWVGQLDRGMVEREVFTRFIDSPEYQSSHRVRLAFPPGHFHSPIVDPDEARRYVFSESHLDPGQLPGLEISLSRMQELWLKHQSVLERTPFERYAGGRTRYYYENHVYPIGDATVYRLMLYVYRPKQIIEIGSGFSTAAALDSLDEARLDTAITAIEPDPDRLYGLLRTNDRTRVRVIKEKVQDIPLSLFAQLGANDILFVDSTHVIKSGSDVCYELFQILPSLRDGVLIHFHDVHAGFEYPEEWLFEQNLSWNEAYALRAFLMFNRRFRVEFMTDPFARHYEDLINKTYPVFLYNPGGSLWLRKSVEDR